jgi:glycosyltransferase involved in cell wall biosynthesis
MKSVAVVYPDLTAKGGGEAVAMNVLEALQRDYDVTLLTLTDPEIEALCGYFGVDVDRSRLGVRRAGRLAPGINRRVGLRYYLLQNALLGRYARRHADEFDLVVSAINELGLGTDSVQYVHFPFDWNVRLDDRDEIFHPAVEPDSVYQRVCTALAGVTRENTRSSTVLANSTWTADKFERAYGTRPTVLFPPIDTRGFTDVPWSARENGFVTVGRIERSKRTVEMIETIGAVRDRGHDVHLHVVGPTADETYYRSVVELAERRPYVDLEGELSRSELTALVSTHRYGIHGKAHEHFGMAVAELAAGGAIPFVPSTGGQRGIVRNRDSLLYDTPGEAVEKIDRVLANRDLQRTLRPRPAEIERRFGRSRFQAAISRAVAESIDRTPGTGAWTPTRASRPTTAKTRP